MIKKKNTVINMSQSYFPEQDIDSFLEEAPKILKSRVSMGEWVSRFEKKASEVQQCSNAFATNSCTSALEISLLACGINPGDEVLVPAQTFIATGMAVSNIGAKPIFCDIKKDTLCLDPDWILKNESDKVKAVIVVYFAGLIPPDIELIKNICKHKNYILIEDAAHAHGSKFKNKPAGNFGDTACFSYYPTKILTTGEGGMVVTNRDDLKIKLKSYQYRGQDLNLPGEQFSRPYGRNIRLPELNALLGVLQYRRLDDFIKKRRTAAEIYNKMIGQENSIFIPKQSNHSFHSYWLYTIILPKGIDRETLKKNCLDNWNINISWSYFPPMHLMPIFINLYGSQPGVLPISEDILSRTICLPIHPLISKEDAKYVSNCFLHEYRKLG